jgi:hypothetical protein
MAAQEPMGHQAILIEPQTDSVMKPPDASSVIAVAPEAASHPHCRAILEERDLRGLAGPRLDPERRGTAHWNEVGDGQQTRRVVGRSGAKLDSGGGPHPPNHRIRRKGAPSHDALHAVPSCRFIFDELLPRR